MEDRGLYKYARTARESRKVREALKRLTVNIAVESHAAVEADLTEIAALVLDILHDPMARQFQARAAAMRNALETTREHYRRGPRAADVEPLGPVLAATLDRSRHKKRA